MKRVLVLALIGTLLLVGQSLAQTSTAAPSKQCLLVYFDGGHRMLGYFVAGVGGALLSGGKYRYLDNVNMTNVKMVYKGSELQNLQKQGVHVYLMNKGANEHEMIDAHNSCVASQPAAPATAAPTPAPAPAAAPASTVAPPASVAPVVVPTPPPTPAAPVAYTQQDDVRVEPATQTTAQPVNEAESLGDAARHAKQRKACLNLAKDNPSIICK